MSRKRSSEEARELSSSTPAGPMKRSRPSPPQPSDSSVASSTHMSENSASRSSPTLTRQSSVSSLESDGMGADEDEGSSSSSEESSVVDSDDDDENEDEDEDEETVTIGGPRKPWMARDGVLDAAPDLRARISAFLPQLAAANQDLESLGPKAASMEDVQEGEQHIEMDLGLGVLEEKQDGGSSSGSEEEDENEDEGAEALAITSSRRKGAETDSGVLDRLMGKKGETVRKPGIQELG
nr:hypothetical protein CFP56_66520 [Quercus suber]